jgi:hypothetical protein
MWDLFRLIFGLIIDLFRSQAALEAEVLVLKQQPIRMLFFGSRQGRSGLGLPPVSEGPRRARHRSLPSPAGLPISSVGFRSRRHHPSHTLPRRLLLAVIGTKVSSSPSADRTATS